MTAGSWGFTILGAVAACHGLRAEPPRIGEAAPEIAVEHLLNAPPNAKATLHDHQGEVVVLEFWATWCGPCLVTVPHLNELVKVFEDRPVRFISITDESNREKVQRTIAKYDMRAWIALDTDGSVLHDYGVTGIPRAFVIDGGGRLRADVHPNQLTPAIIEAALRPAAPQSPAPAGPVPDRNPEPKIAVPQQEFPSSDRVRALSHMVQPLFEATVQLADPDTNQTYAMGQTNIDADAMPLGQAIAMAARVSSTRIRLPQDLASTRVNIRVRVPPSKKERLRPALADALRDSFGVSIERKVMPTDVLVLSKSGDGDGSLAPSAAGAQDSHSSSSPGVVLASGREFDELTSQLEQVLGVPVIDETGIKGAYDWDLKYATPELEDIKNAVLAQLGLALTPAKRPLEMVVVDHAKP